MTVNVVVSFINKKERWKIREKSQAVKDARRRLVSLTTEMCTKGCFTARYLSILTTNKWISEKPTRQLITSLKSKNGHSLLRNVHWVRLLSTTRLTWVEQISQTGISVVAIIAVMKSSFSFLRRKMLMIMFKVRAIWTTLEGCCSLPLKKANVGFSWWIAWLEFMASFFPGLVSSQGSFCVNINAARLNFC